MLAGSLKRNRIRMIRSSRARQTNGMSLIGYDVRLCSFIFSVIIWPGITVLLIASAITIQSVWRYNVVQIMNQDFVIADHIALANGCVLHSSAME